MRKSQTDRFHVSEHGTFQYMPRLSCLERLFRILWKPVFQVLDGFAELSQVFSDEIFGLLILARSTFVPFCQCSQLFVVSSLRNDSLLASMSSVNVELDSTVSLVVVPFKGGWPKGAIGTSISSKRALIKYMKRGNANPLITEKKTPRNSRTMSNLVARENWNKSRTWVDCIFV